MKQLYVVTLRLRVLAESPLDALHQGYEFMDGDRDVVREPREIEEDLRDVRPASSREQRRRVSNLNRAGAPQP